VEVAGGVGDAFDVGAFVGVGGVDLEQEVGD
jgi:hypothetical protein